MKFLLPLFLFFVLACRNSSPPPADQKTAAADTAKFYPLDQFFKQQIEYVDLHNFPVYRITTRNGKQDSAAISTEEFKKYASTFLKYDLSDPAVKAGYRETVFQDLSTGSLTLNYAPAGVATVRNIDVLLDEESHIVKRVFIRAQYAAGDTTVTEQCSWKADKSMQINRSLTGPGGGTRTELNYINWNDKP